MYVVWFLNKSMMGAWNKVGIYTSITDKPANDWELHGDVTNLCAEEIRTQH